MPQFLSFYLSLNIAIVGLAFIFELTRNLILGGQTFGGMFGVTLDTPREIRTEELHKAVKFHLPLLVFRLYCAPPPPRLLQGIRDLMPFTSDLENRGFNEEMRLLATWMFIAVGNAVFLFTWLLSIARLSPLRQIRFDLDPESDVKVLSCWLVVIGCVSTSKCCSQEDLTPYSFPKTINRR